MSNTKINSKKKTLIIIVAIVIIAAMAVGGVVVYNNFASSQPTPSNGVVGKISDGWDTGIEEESSPQKQGVQIPGYATAEMKSGDTSLNIALAIQNRTNADFTLPSSLRTAPSFINQIFSNRVRDLQVFRFQKHLSRANTMLWLCTNV